MLLSNKKEFDDLLCNPLFVAGLLLVDGGLLGEDGGLLPLIGEGGFFLSLSVPNINEVGGLPLLLLVSLLLSNTKSSSELSLSSLLIDICLIDLLPLLILGLSLLVAVVSVICRVDLLPLSESNDRRFGCIINDLPNSPLSPPPLLVVAVVPSLLLLLEVLLLLRFLISISSNDFLLLLLTSLCDLRRVDFSWSNIISESSMDCLRCRRLCLSFDFDRS